MSARLTKTSLGQSPVDADQSRDRPEREPKRPQGRPGVTPTSDHGVVSVGDKAKIALKDPHIGTKLGEKRIGTVIRIADKSVVLKFSDKKTGIARSEFWSKAQVPSLGARVRVVLESFDTRTNQFVCTWLDSHHKVGKTPLVDSTAVELKLGKAIKLKPPLNVAKPRTTGKLLKRRTAVGYPGVPTLIPSAPNSDTLEVTDPSAETSSWDRALSLDATAFQAALPELLKTALGKHAVIHRGGVLGTFASRRDGLAFAYTRFGLREPFLVKEVVDERPSPPLDILIAECRSSK